MAQVIASIVCFVSNLPGPPIYHWQNFSLSLWPVSRSLCSGIDPHRDVIFHLYTRKNPQHSQILLKDDDSSISNSYLDFAKPTVIFLHGFMQSHLLDEAQQIKNGYLKRGDYNVILMDCERLLAGPEYIHAAKNTRPIGKYTAQFVDYLITLGLDLDRFHVIGMSLGAHIAGFLGQSVTKGRIRRITGLEPARPLFEFNGPADRLDPSDALFVDVIHTNAGYYGISYSVGHLDFWPNGGTKQDGCKPYEIFLRQGISINGLLFCHHIRSYQLYTLSINNQYGFASQLCKSYKDYQAGLCQHTATAYLGIGASPSNVHGDYYLDTGLIGINV